MSHKATNWAVEQRGLKPATKVVLWHLADCHNPREGCFPSQQYLSEECELSRSAINEHLKILEARGLIRRERCVDQKTWRQQSTRYILGFEIDEMQGVSVSGIRTRAVSGKRAKPCPESGH